MAGRFEQRVSRRSVLSAGAGAVAAGAFGGPLVRIARSTKLFGPTAEQAAALRVLGRSQLRHPDSLPFPRMLPGTDTLPEIEHIVVLMLENHSYDNLFGMLGRGPGQRPRGDGFTLGEDGRPTAANLYPSVPAAATPPPVAVPVPPLPGGVPALPIGTPTGGSRIQHAFHMPTTCQQHAKPSQEWKQSHIQWAGGRNDGFVISDSGPVAMGYWTEDDLPFTNDLATHFPIADRWFASALAQTDPQRRFLIAATSSGMTDDIGTGPGNVIPDATLPLPANGTIFDRLTSFGISWTDYYTTFPTGVTAELYPLTGTGEAALHKKPIAQFYTDAASGRLPGFSLLDPDYGTESQENPQNLVVGEAMLARVVRALASSPKWRKTMLIVTYDEHGGYYDHVPPPVALAPDAIPPTVQPGEQTYDGFRRFGFRVPALVISPYAKRDHVSHRVYDHTSILAMVERKWNLPAMTFRDANANDLTDFIDLRALRRRHPTFPQLPPLRPAGDTAAALACSSSGPGTIPPPGSVSG